MSTVDLITFCCPKDIARLHAVGELEALHGSHHYTFDEFILVYQRCEGFPTPHLSWVTQVKSEDHPDILREFRFGEDQSAADTYTHGEKAAHYWKWHVINHLIGLKVSTADYIVFSDCDCRMINQPDMSWVKQGIHYLETYPQILIVSPSDGGSMAERLLPGGVRLTQNVSQQMFLCRRDQMKNIDFDLPWNWEFLAPGGPMQEYYYMLEGRIWRYMAHHNMWRAILPEKWRYWHFQW